MNFIDRCWKNRLTGYTDVHAINPSPDNPECKQPQ